MGKRFLPKALSSYFSSGGVVILETPLSQRIQNTFDEYVMTAQAEYSLEYGGEEGLAHWFAAMISNMRRIGKRLGGSQMEQVSKLLEQAHRFQIHSGSAEQHRAWVEILLVDYYDPMYDYQIEKKAVPLFLPALLRRSCPTCRRRTSPACCSDPHISPVETARLIRRRVIYHTVVA